MPGPFVFVAANKVKEGKLEGEKQRVPGWVEFIHSNEPRLIAFHEYLSADGTEVEYVQVHPDTDSFENHMRVVERSGRSYTQTLGGTTSIRIYGTTPTERPLRATADGRRGYSAMRGHRCRVRGWI
jgi:hypothetical protein